MENRGYEEEQPRARSGPCGLSPGEQSPREFPSAPATSDRLSTGNDGHVYEDISCVSESVPGLLPGTRDGKTTSEDVPAALPRKFDTVDRRKPFDVDGRVSREASARSSTDSEDAGGAAFRRNLTLPLRREAGFERIRASSSVRLTSEPTRNAPEEESSALENAEAATRDTSPRLERKPSRRRKKKDCKHCRNKVGECATRREEDRAQVAILKKSMDKGQPNASSPDDAEARTTILAPPRNFGLLPVCRPVGKADVAAIPAPTGRSSCTVFSISEKVRGTLSGPCSPPERIGYERNDVAPKLVNEEGAPIGQEKTRGAGMRVNSIYSQERCYAKEPPIFFTDVKERVSFQRAYSLPVRTQSPAIQNRVNLRRSVRGEPPPQPARLHKHRHGWTLHFARPLEGQGCTRTLVLLLLLVLALLGVGATALYIVCEPEKLRIIQQYLRSATGNSSLSSVDAASNGASVPSPVQNDEQNGTSTVTTSPTTSPSGTLVVDALLSGGSPFPLSTEAETEITSGSSDNYTRYCDDCLPGEVCVALVSEEVPICRTGLDREDPTGCAGLCLVNKQKCHRLDVDAFRCVEVEHYCLDDEWTCSNTLCIPVEKRCDGHMNCYDHSDEYDCVCDLETHFQCGNETSCLPLEKRCDGKIDCWDAADEINCTLGRNLGWSCPLENQFTCSNGQCILKARFCDGLPDCADGSDEPHGCQGRCNKHEFTCENSRCIAKGMKCNGVDDCGDGTDERHCKGRRS